MLAFSAKYLMLANLRTMLYFWFIVIYQIFYIIFLVYCYLSNILHSSDADNILSVLIVKP